MSPSSRFALFSCIALVSAACAAPAVGQIQFTLTDSRSVARGPQFAATGRFDPDSPPGVALTSFWIDEVTVFPTSSAGVLVEPFVLGLGRNLRDLVSFDLNGDGIDDLIVADEAGGSRSARLFAITRVIGGFSEPVEVVLDTTMIEAAAAGNFDGVAPLDVVTTNGRAGTVSLAYGTPLGLVPQGNVFLAGTTNAATPVDLNGDGLDDLAVLTERDDGISAVTLLQSDGVGFAVLGAATELDVDGVQMVAGSFDADDITDLAVITQGPDVREYGLRTLLNPSPAPAELPSSIEAQQLDCPLDARGNISRCKIFDAVKGDFDQDGLEDVALSMSDPGVVVVLPRIAGGYGIPILLDVQGSPRGLAVGDLSGDGVADLVITDFDGDLVTIATSVLPVKKPTGEACLEAAECASAACVDSTCCATPVCPLGERCDISGAAGECRRPLDAGQPCAKDTDCLSQSCLSESGTCAQGAGGCVGDCNEDGLVTVDEIVVIIQIALGQAGIETCEAADAGGDGTITVDEIVAALDAALDGC